MIFEQAKEERKVLHVSVCMCVLHTRKGYVQVAACAEISETHRHLIVYTFQLDCLLYTTIVIIVMNKEKGNRKTEKPTQVLQLHTISIHMYNS